MNEIHLKICEEREWRVTEYEDGYDLQRSSPAGEDFIAWIPRTEKGFAYEVFKYAEEFDADEHAGQFVESRGKRGVPDSIRELIEDADEIQNMLNELSEALQEAERNG